MPVAGSTASRNTLKSRWRSREHVGEAKPSVTVLVRQARMKREFRHVARGEAYCFIPKTGPKRRIWYGYLHPRSDFFELPNVDEVTLDQSFDSNGVMSATITIDNVKLEQDTGPGGVFHAIERGWYSPTRGYNPPGTRKPTASSQNNWYDILRQKSTQILILGGYGDAQMPLFNGLLNEVDMTSRPDKIAITARCFGQFLTDQPVFGWAKHPKVQDPITFADRLRSDDVDEVGNGARATSNDNENFARFATDEDESTKWISGRNGSPSQREWIQIDLPHGRYETVKINPFYGGQKAYLCLYATHKRAPGGRGAQKGRIDAEWVGSPHHYTNVPQGWVNEGKGHVPGTDIPFIKEVEVLKGGNTTYTLPSSYRVGDDSKLRLYITNLHVDTDTVRNAGGGVGPTKKTTYRAGLRSFYGLKRKRPQDVKQNKWILVDDAADIVRTVLQWNGIHDWEVEDTGVRLKDKMVFNRQSTMMDIIKKVAEMTNYVFYLRPPDTFDQDNPDDDAQTVVGVFRYNQALTNRPLETRQQIRDDQVLTGIEARFSDEPLAQFIRVRGKRASRKKGGRTLFGDMTHRYTYSYVPPWARHDDVGNGGVKKQTVHYDNMIRSLTECKVACLIIAFRQILEASVATLEIPANPLIYPDMQLSLFDRGTGLSTRLYVTNRRIEFTGGESGTFKMSIGGSLLDIPDAVAVRKELVHLLNDHGINPYPAAYYRTAPYQVYWDDPPKR